MKRHIRTRHKQGFAFENVHEAGGNRRPAAMADNTTPEAAMMKWASQPMLHLMEQINPNHAGRWNRHLDMGPAHRLQIIKEEVRSWKPELP